MMTALLAALVLEQLAVLLILAALLGRVTRPVLTPMQPMELPFQGRPRAADPANLVADSLAPEDPRPPHCGPTRYAVCTDVGEPLYDGVDGALALAVFEEHGGVFTQRDHDGDHVRGRRRQ